MRDYGEDPGTDQGSSMPASNFFVNNSNPVNPIQYLLSLAQANKASTTPAWKARQNSPQMPTTGAGTNPLLSRLQWPTTSAGGPILPPSYVRPHSWEGNSPTPAGDPTGLLALLSQGRQIPGAAGLPQLQPTPWGQLNQIRPASGGGAVLPQLRAMQLGLSGIPAGASDQNGPLGLPMSVEDARKNAAQDAGNQTDQATKDKFLQGLAQAFRGMSGMFGGGQPVPAAPPVSVIPAPTLPQANPTSVTPAARPMVQPRGRGWR